METLFRLISGATAAAAAFLLPVAPLLAAAVAFVAADFLSGIAAARAASRRPGPPWGFGRPGVKKKRGGGAGPGSGDSRAVWHGARWSSWASWPRPW